MSKEHAEHNESLCDFLLSNGGFNDWVVTTAFYSALHYVHSSFFPLEKEGKKYKKFSNYYHGYVKRKQKAFAPTKHIATIELVKDVVRSAEPEYRWLHDACRTARYSNYEVADGEANLARNMLSNFKAKISTMTLTSSMN